MRVLLLALITCDLMLGCSRPSSDAEFLQVLSLTPSGAVEHGSKAALEQAVREGQRVRVGFGLDFDNDGKMEIEHWADASFVSLYRGEIFVQLMPIQEQNPARDKAEIHFPTPPHPWTGMLDTTGRLRSWFPNEPATEVRVASWWYVGRSQN
jgi:hypothetical protein